MKYILIILMAHSHGVSTTTAEFNNLQSCERAAKAVFEKKPESWIRINAVCAAKG